MSEKSLDGRARRAARRADLMARKSRWRAGTCDNLGGYMLIEPRRNLCIRGRRFDLTAAQVIQFCENQLTPA